MGEYFIQNLKFLRIFILYLLVGPHGTDSQNSYREGVNHYLVISLDLTQRCPCTSSLVAADEHFHRKESGYKLEETARSSQENVDLSDSK